MPIFEYHCDACGADFEKLVFGPDPSVTCDQCGSGDTQKRLSRFGMGRSSTGSSSAGSGSSCGSCSASSCAGCK